MRAAFIALIFTFTVFNVAACTRERSGPFERTGARIDEMSDNVREGRPMLHRKGPMEEAGEALDDAFDDDND